MMILLCTLKWKTANLQLEQKKEWKNRYIIITIIDTEVSGLNIFKVK